MMKKKYLKPTTECVVAETQGHLLTNSPTGNGGTIVGGGNDGDDNKETGGSGSGGDGEFVGGLGAKDHNAWSTWDD